MLALCASATVAVADTITFGGTIIQAQDPSQPATNNASLNNIQLLDAYLVTLVFPGSITAPGSYNLAGATLTFSDPTASASETGFDSIHLTITANAGFDEFSLLGCLTTGSGCVFGNQLSANFRIPAASLNAQNVAATGLDQPHPVDLLEDDGLTDIHGSISTYSYTGAAAVPEPSTGAFLAIAIAALISGRAALRRLNNSSRGAI